MSDENIEFEMENRDPFEEEERGRPVGLIIALVIFILLTLGLAAILAMNEFASPLFGKAKKMYAQAEQVDAITAEKDSMQTQIEELMKENAYLSESAPNFNDGVFFEVQIGAFEFFRAREYMMDLQKFGIDQDDGVNKYTIGRFRKLKDAQAFRKDIQRMGITDAWIVARVNGERTEDLKAAERLSAFN